MEDAGVEAGRAEPASRCPGGACHMGRLSRVDNAPGASEPENRQETKHSTQSCTRKNSEEGLEGRGEEEEEEEDLFVFNDTIEGPREPAVKPGRVTQA